MMRFTSVSDVCGSSTGMKRSEPSLSGGMNSLPMPRGQPPGEATAEILSSTGSGRPKARSAAARSEDGFAMPQGPIEHGIVEAQEQAHDEIAILGMERSADERRAEHRHDGDGEQR
jgi:hypothetical protein